MRTIDRAGLMALLGYRSPVSIDNLERRGLLPPRIRTGPNKVRWDLDAVEAMVRARPVGIGAEIVVAEKT